MTSILESTGAVSQMGDYGTDENGDACGEANGLVGMIPHRTVGVTSDRLYLLLGLFNDFGASIECGADTIAGGRNLSLCSVGGSRYQGAHVIGEGGGIIVDGLSSCVHGC